MRLLLLLGFITFQSIAAQYGLVEYQDKQYWMRVSQKRHTIMNFCRQDHSTVLLP